MNKLTKWLTHIQKLKINVPKYFKYFYTFFSLLDNFFNHFRTKYVSGLFMLQIISLLNFIKSFLRQRKLF